MSTKPAAGGKASSSDADKKKQEQPSASKPVKQEPIDVVDDTPFPVPELYFKVYESEEDEPESKIRRDVNKLYEKWTKEYGRRWPDRGLNTEDLVWLEEESGKRPGGRNTTTEQRKPLPPGWSTVEKEEYEGEFISEAGDEGTGKGAAGGAKQAKRAIMSNHEATKAGGVWVTDEFESDEYMAGNLELMWNMYLWDRDGNTTIMPGGPPDEAAGEESEDWDDFHTAYRPRGVDSDEARDAVWVTDEFESDEDNTESEWEPEYVGAGMGLDAEDPVNPQYSLRHSTHPLAPFPGEPLKWDSIAYDDGTTFEGLTREAVPHGLGVMVFGNGTGGGFHFRDVRRADKYEGEFQAGYAHGLGMFTSELRGEVYVGEFFAGQRHGCGIKINMKPYYYLMERGEDPVAAYRKTHEQIMRNIEFRTWYRNKPLGSDYEDEVVLQAVNDDLDNPYDVVLRNARHEAKVKDWMNMAPEQKVLSKMVDIIESVGGERMARRAAYGFEGPGYFKRDHKGRLVEDLDSQGNDTEYDSMDLMVGNTTEGGLGLGWIQDTQGESEFPYDPKLAEAIAGDVLDDKMEESEDKEMILGDDMLNPFTGLSVKDYLDGKESKYKEFLHKTMGDRLAKAKGKGRGTADLGNGMGIMTGNRFDPEDSSYVEEEGPGISVQTNLSRRQQDMLLQDMDKYDAVYGSNLRGRRQPFEEGTDTRFETESEMMQMCELAEILGTVDEAQEIVNRARMWRWKPYGEVTLRYAQDGQGAPLELMQDPLHYPHGTKFMAPGPLGQVHPLPDDRNIRVEMLRVAQNYKKLYEMYNFDYDPEPGSVQYKIDQRIKRAGELRKSLLGHLEEDVEAELANSGAAEPALMAALPEEVSRAASSAGPAGTAPAPVVGFRGFGGSSTFACMSASSMGRASRVVLDALTHAAKHAPAKRPSIIRPSQMARRKASSNTNSKQQ